VNAVVLRGEGLYSYIGYIDTSIFIFSLCNCEPCINGALYHVQKRVRVLVAVTIIDLPTLPLQKQIVIASLTFIYVLSYAKTGDKLCLSSFYSWSLS
jgi:hypothetical protein